MITKRVVGLTTAAIMLSAQASAATEIQWWHAMGGALGEKVNEIAAGYNSSQDEFTVKPVYKGSYPETMTGAIAAFRSNKQPHIVQVYEVGTATMMAAEKAIYPVHQLMTDTKEPFSVDNYLSAVTSYYTDNGGNMLSMPFNSSTPVLYYNKKMFRDAGLNENKPPQTWEELEAAAKKIVASGAKCGFTTGYQSWVQIENFAARQNIPLATNNNGFDGKDTSLLINKPEFVQHISKMAEWKQAGIFEYGGRASDAAPLFYSGKCAMYMNSSAGYAGVNDNMKGTEVGVAQLPYWKGMIKQPQNSIIGGASLWVLQGHKKQEYKGVSNFFSYLSSPAVQADWHQFTGYLPITEKAYQLTKSQGFYGKNPGTEQAIKQMTSVATTANSKGIRLGNFVQIRNVINEELEAVWAGKKTAQQALDQAVERSNKLLKRFERVNS